jgi:malate synthase
MATLDWTFVFGIGAATLCYVWGRVAVARDDRQLLRRMKDAATATAAISLLAWVLWAVYSGRIV